MLYDWQTLLGAVLAVAAAVIGSVLLWRQTRLAGIHEEERRRRRFNAARATLPATLSVIMRYLHQAARRLKAIHGPAGQFGYGNEALRFDPPQFPDEVAAALERMIEATGTNEVADWVADLLSELQTFGARLDGLTEADTARASLQLSVEDYLLQAARIYSQTARLFPFARRHKEGVEYDPKATSVELALHLLKIGDQFSRLYERAAAFDKLLASRAKIIPPAPAASP
jgi:hypothetical protein